MSDNNPANNNQTSTNSTAMTIREAARFLDISEQYTRQLVFGDKLHAEKIDGVWKISFESLQAYKNSHSVDKTTAYTIYLTDAQYQKVVDVLMNVRIEKKFDADKAREYRARRDAKRENGQAHE